MTNFCFNKNNIIYIIIALGFVILLFIQQIFVFQRQNIFNEILIPNIFNPNIINNDIQSSNNMSNIRYKNNSINSNDNDWFHKDLWETRHKYLKQSCQIRENICVYNQHFYVNNKYDTFKLKTNGFNLLGYDGGDQVRYITFMENKKLYQDRFRTSIWKGNEFNDAKCEYNDITNHMIIEANYQHMVGEFYVRTLYSLWVITKNNGLYNDTLFDKYKILSSDNIKLWILLKDQTPIFTAHELLLEPHSRYNVEHVMNLFDKLKCQCFTRMFFCGMRINSSYNGSEYSKQFAPNGNMVVRANKDHYRYMIQYYNDYVERKDIHLERDILKFKRSLILKYYNVSILTESMEEKLRNNKYKFIGLYQRLNRRRWKNIDEICKYIENDYKYNKYNLIFICYTIILENHMHPRDVVIIHKSMILLMGIHGAHLTDGIFINNNNDTFPGPTIVELLPFNGPPWTTSLDMPTPLGVIFTNSNIFHVGFQLSNGTRKKEHSRRQWNSDWIVRWERLHFVFEFLMLNGGPCMKKLASKIMIPDILKNMPFGIYNQYCPP